MLTATIFIILSFVIIGYLLGSILFGSIISKIFKVNVRRVGSHNVGGTNISRVLGKKVGILVMFVDAVKSCLAVVIAWVIFKYSIHNWYVGNTTLQTTIYLAGIGTVIGHCFPITYLIAIFKFKFDLKKCDLYKGGKGVASTGGLLFAISPWIALIALGIFIILILLFKYISLGSILTSWLSAFLVWIPKVLFLYLNYGTIIQPDWQFQLIIMIIIIYCAILITIRHRENIIRIFSKQERKIF